VDYVNNLLISLDTVAHEQPPVIRRGVRAILRRSNTGFAHD
jgi:hypothetical protein